MIIIIVLFLKIYVNFSIIFSEIQSVYEAVMHIFNSTSCVDPLPVLILLKTRETFITSPEAPSCVLCRMGRHLATGKKCRYFFDSRYKDRRDSTAEVRTFGVQSIAAEVVRRAQL